MLDRSFAEKISQCPLCESGSDSSHIHPSQDRKVECLRCGHFFVEGLLAASGHYGPDKHLLGGYTREQWESLGKCVDLADSNLEQILAQCPRTPKEQAEKLLLAIQRRTQSFGTPVELNWDKDYPLAYARDKRGLNALIDYLNERGFIKPVGGNAERNLVQITVSGCEAIESRILSPPLTVFISSTCYDLLDLRAELADFLESTGFIVKVSDDPYRIHVEPTEDSIQTCLRNVDTADMVVCVLDQRYGPLLPPSKEVSATHAEIRHARELKRPIYIFMRDKALSDYDRLRKDEKAKTLWVERDDQGKRMKWLAFAKELQEFAAAQTQGYSNWVDPFRDSVQLKKLVLKRLGEYQRRWLSERVSK